MSLALSSDRVLLVYRELGQILEDLGPANHLPQALLDRLSAMHKTLLQELNTTQTATPGDVHAPLAAKPKSFPISESGEKDALSRLDDDGGGQFMVEGAEVEVI